MSYHNEPALTGDAKPATWPDLAYWREVAEQRERDLDAARTMICELSRRPTVEEYNCLITELRRRGWPGPILTGAAPAPPAKPAFPLRAMRTWHRPLP